MSTTLNIGDVLQTNPLFGSNSKSMFMNNLCYCKRPLVYNSPMLIDLLPDGSRCRICCRDLAPQWGAAWYTCDAEPNDCIYRKCTGGCYCVCAECYQEDNCNINSDNLDLLPEISFILRKFRHSIPYIS